MVLPFTSEKPCPVIAGERFAVTVPTFAIVSICVAVCPSETVPKLRLVVLGDSTAAFDGFPFEPLPLEFEAEVVYPAQLERLIASRIAAKDSRKAKDIGWRSFWSRRPGQVNDWFLESVLAVLQFVLTASRFIM